MESHFEGHKTAQRILLAGPTWCSDEQGNKSVHQCATEYAGTCSTCQLFARKTCFDNVPIQAVKRNPTH